MSKVISISIKCDSVPKVVSEMLERKEAIRKYHSGEMSKAEFDTYGIVFARPIDIIEPEKK